MAYDAFIDTNFYTATYKGSPIEDADFVRFALRASDEVDKLTYGRIRRRGLDSFDVNTQTAVRLATCAMAEALAQIAEATDGAGVAMGSEKVGNYSYTVDAVSLASLRSDARAQARAYLFPTGLLYAGIDG